MTPTPFCISCWAMKPSWRSARCSSPRIPRCIARFAGTDASSRISLSDARPFAEQPILSEVARFEWTLAEVFDAADAAPLERTPLRPSIRTTWAELNFRFHPSLRRLPLAWNTRRSVAGDERR